MSDSPANTLRPFERVGYATGLLTESGFSSTIFEEMSALSTQHSAINLGQGFPDTDGPQEIFDAATKAMTEGHNQYAPISGHPLLRQAIADHQERFYGQKLDEKTQVLVSAGASEALSASVAALVNPGEEVLVFEPYYDIYPAALALARAKLVTVPLLAPSFEPDMDVLEAAFSDRTAMVIINNPHNPTGAVFSPQVQETIVSLAQKFDAVIVQDAVYEHLTYEGTFTPIFSMDGAGERTLYVSAISKTHSLTGWRVGWVVGPERLIAQVKLVKGYFSHSAAAPLQIGAATGLLLPDSFYQHLQQAYSEQKNILVSGLQKAGLHVSDPAGTFFCAADATDWMDQRDISSALELSQVLVAEAGIAVVPLSAFVTQAHAPAMNSWVRFAFCKKPAVLQKASNRLKKWAES